MHNKYFIEHEEYMAQLQLDATQYAPLTGNGVCFPISDYPVEIVKVEREAVKGSNNQKGMLIISLKILSGTYVGQVQKDRLNLWNDSEQAVRMAHQQLSAYMHVIGRLRINDDQELIGGRLIVLIGPQEDNDKYSEVKAVKDLQGNPPVQGQPGSQQSHPATTQTQVTAAQPNTFAGGNPPVQPQQPAFGATQTAQPSFGAAANASPAGNKPPWA